jgi:hypothetical protein
MNLLAVNPDKQKKARQELAEICGDRPVAVTDKSNLPYNEAVCFAFFALQLILFFIITMGAQHLLTRVALQTCLGILYVRTSKRTLQCCNKVY